MKKLLLLLVLQIADLKLNPFWKTNHESMIATIEHTFTGVPAQQILTAQVVFNRAKDGIQINCLAGVGQQRRAGPGREKIFAAGLFREVAKATCRRTHGQTPVAWLEERQVDNVEGNVVCQRCLNYGIRFDRAYSVEAVADQNDEPAFGTNLTQSVESFNRCKCGVEDCRVLSGLSRKIECFACCGSVGREGDHQRRLFGETDDGDLRLLTEATRQRQRCLALL